MSEKIETWHEIIDQLEKFYTLLEHFVRLNNGATWQPYIAYVQKELSYAIDQSRDPNNVVGLGGSISGLSRYFDEFYWEPDIYYKAKMHLERLAILDNKLSEVI